MRVRLDTIPLTRTCGPSSSTHAYFPPVFLVCKRVVLPTFENGAKLVLSLRVWSPKKTMRRTTIVQNIRGDTRLMFGSVRLMRIVRAGIQKNDSMQRINYEYIFHENALIPPPSCYGIQLARKTLATFKVQGERCFCARMPTYVTHSLLYCDLLQVFR